MKKISRIRYCKKIKKISYDSLTALKQKFTKIELDLCI